VNATLDLWDWRRRVSEVYAAIRQTDDPMLAWTEWRGVRDELFRDHPQSPLERTDRAMFRGLAYFPYDPAMRFVVGLAPPGDAGRWDVPAGENGMVQMQPFARTQGLLGPLGGELTLFWIMGYGGGVFLPFADATSGQETYGAGRYLLDTIKGADLGRAADGRIVLDFNFSYCPSCAYSPRFVCPLAPAENRLPGAVRAGERL
jgi:uncharacterized protein